MTFLPSLPNPASPDESLWLVIQQGARRLRCFELRANCHRAIAVGSARNADFRVDGAPPVAFYVEREGAILWVTRAYSGDDLRIDTQKLETRFRLHRLSKIEFASISLDLVVRDAPPTLRRIDIPVAEDGGAELDDAFREFEGNRELMATREFEPWRAAPGALSRTTGEYSRSDFLPAAAFPTTTLEINRRDLEQLFEAGEPKADRELGITRKMLAGHDGPPIQPHPIIDVTTPPESLCLDDPLGRSGQTNGYWPPKFTPSRKTGSENVRIGIAQADCAAEIERRARKRKALVLKPEPPPLTTLDKLGLLTKERPLSVLGGALVAAVAMSIFLVGAAEVFGWHSLNHANRLLAVPDTSHLATTSPLEDRRLTPIEPKTMAQSPLDHEQVSPPRVAPSVVARPIRR